VTEHEWQTGADPELMLEFLGKGASERKLRLFVCACCRRFDLGHASRYAVNAAEQLADGMISREKMREVMRSGARSAHRALERTQSAHQRAVLNSAWAVLSAGALEDAVMLDAVMDLVKHTRLLNQIAVKSEPFLFSDLLHCIFGNPFRPVELDPRWRTSTVMDLAAAIYEERTFDKLPILGDALMDAGCDSPELINHCQNEGPHILGCWPVDLILQKS